MTISSVQKEAALKILDTYKRDGYEGRYRGRVFKDFREWDRERLAALKVMRPELQKYLSGSMSLVDFRGLSNRLCLDHKLWGFNGPSGQMFINQLSKWTKNPDKTNDTLRTNIRLPLSREEAAAKIRAMADALRADFADMPVRIASVPFLLSYFWQIQDPEFAPIYFPVSKEVFESLGLFEPSEDLGQAYLDYWQLHDELANLFADGFDKAKDNKYWFVEHAIWAYQAKRKADPEASYETHGDASVVADAPLDAGALALIGTWKDVDDRIKDIREVIKAKGGWASVWDFPIKDGAEAFLKPPFYVYLNVGRGVLKYRMKVSELRSTRGSQGLLPPWPDITDPGNLGKTHGDGFIFKTWFKVTAIEDMQPALNAFDIKPATRWTKNTRTLLHQSTFGYFYMPSEGDAEEVDETQTVPYSLDDATKGIFLPKTDLAETVDLLRRKKNVILQGPPGVGKSYIARRLAYALIGSESERQVGFVQFHQSYGYEDFIQGFRPKKDGTFELTRGVFFRFCEAARQLPEHRFVFIIDEINRGNLSKIFGELMLLIEADKRGPAWKTTLTYDQDQEEFFVPPNVHLLGLMNTADRSLALVDYALRRRFAFVDLQPGFESSEFDKFLRDRGATPALIGKIRGRLGELNQAIEADKDLGSGFRIGHSYFCPGDGVTRVDGEWYARIVRREIEPLLREYWFDRPSEAVRAAVDRLLAS